MLSRARMVGQLIAALVVVAALSGCVMNSFAGEGPLQLSPGVSDLYAEYSIRTRPFYFLVTADGRCATYSHCTSDRGCRIETVAEEFKPCEDHCGAPCMTLARRGKISWKGPVTDAEGALLNP